MLPSDFAPPPMLQGTKCRLRAPRLSDCADRLAIGRHAEFVRMSGGSIRGLLPLTTDDARHWYDKLARERYGWVIDVGGRGVGAARLLRLDEANRQADYAIGIFNPSLWNGGLGTEVTRLILTFAFEELRLHRVGLIVLDINVRAQRAYEKCGFRREGIVRDSILIDGEWHSDVAMSIMEDEYRAIAAQW